MRHAVDVQLYAGTSADFIGDATQNRIAEKLSDAFVAHFSHQPGQAEVASWRNSLRAMAQALQLGGLDDHGIVVEWQLPLTSRRLDFLITGRDDRGKANAVIVELKQWEQVGTSNVDDCVTTWVGGRMRDVLHPSRQVGNYQRYLLDVHTAFSDGAVGLQACSYAHNLNYDPSSPLFDPMWEPLLAQHPLYAGDRVPDLVDQLTAALERGDGVAVLDEVQRGTYRPHKRLMDHTAKVIRNEPAYVLLDNQLVTFNTIMARVRARSLSMARRSVFIVKGGPGTGKSVIALNLVGELSAQGLVTHHATGSKAFTTNLRKAVGTRASALFTYFNGYSTGGHDLDVLVCDEAHRIRETSNSRWTKKDQRSTRPQVEELIEAARVSVFLLDDLQAVRPGEIGSSAYIRGAAERLGADIVELELDAQFRCNGSDAYLQWVDNTLGVRATPQVLWDPTDPFDLDVVDTVEELEALVRSKAASGATARPSAGFCWPWSDPRPDGTLVDDVQVGGWSMPWNAKSSAGRLTKGIPREDLWATDPRGIDQVGCVYTAQGFEYDFAGVIWGRDLIHRPRDGWGGQRQLSKDNVVKRAVTDAEFTRLVKHTYRVLLTRGLRGCALYFEDQQTRDFVLSRIDWARR